jgi:hypothetical protein
MTAKITEIADGGSSPNSPTVEQMRESQRLGSIGKGTQDQVYCEMEGDFNMGMGEYADKNSSFQSRAHNYPIGPDYAVRGTEIVEADVASEKSQEGSLPWA